MLPKIGTVISTGSTPNQSLFHFVLDTSKGIPVRKNQYVVLKSQEGKLISMVMDVIKTNRYFQRAESVREYEKSGNHMTNIFPTDRWEYVVAEAQPLGVYQKDNLRRPTFPPSPGTMVHLAPPDLLTKFLGIDNQGLHIGTLECHDIPLKLNMTKLIQKHHAILGISGSGKSFTVSVVIEEILKRKKGKIGVVIIDVHGEYTGFAESNDRFNVADRVKIVKGQEFRIGTPNMNANYFASLIPKMSTIQVRELGKIISKLKAKFKEKNKPYNLKDLISAITDEEDLNESTRLALLGWMNELDALRLFNYSDYPSCNDIKPGHMLIIDLSDTINLRKKQMIVAYFSKKLFNFRRAGRIPPFVEVIEEAHQFAPEGAKREAAISRYILETIAREGRKFYASLCLVSQRPIQLSTTVLSQANTHLILRVTNPYDLDHIGRSSEGITRQTLDTISTLKVGECLIVGEAINYPVFARIRKRESPEPPHARSLEEYAEEYEKMLKIRKKDIKTFV